MDTNALRLFVLAAEKLNISAAGRELGLAPAVATAWLSKLEKTLGADLLHRSTRKVSLSLEGAEFLPYARDIIMQEDAARVALGRGQAEAVGTLRFTAPSTFAQQYIIPILSEFMAQQPRIKLDLRLSDRQMDLIDGSYDLALRNAVLEDSTLKARKLADDRRILCAAPSYLDRFGIPKSPDDLKDHQLIAFGTSSERSLVSHSGAQAHFHPSQSACNLTIDDGLSHRIATAQGLGISANSIWSIHEDIRTGTLVRVLPDYCLAEETALWLVYPQANVLSAKVRLFIDFLIAKIGKQPPWRDALDSN